MNASTSINIIKEFKKQINLANIMKGEKLRTLDKTKEYTVYSMEFQALGVRCQNYLTMNKEGASNAQLNYKLSWSYIIHLQDKKKNLFQLKQIRLKYILVDQLCTISFT